MAIKQTPEDKKKITIRTLLVIFSFILSYIILTFISAQMKSEDVPENVTGLKPALFNVLIIYQDGSFGLTEPFGSNTSSGPKNPPPVYSIPKGKEDYFCQAFPKQMEELTRGKTKTEMSVKNISDGRQEITILLEGDNGYKSYNQYETDGRNIYPKFSIQHPRGHGMGFMLWNFLYAAFIAFLTFIGVKLYYGQKLISYSGVS